MKFDVVFASTLEGGIGYNNDLLVYLPHDLRHFKTITKDGVVIMGRKTWQSLPPTARPLKHRVNVVITRKDEEPARKEFDIPGDVAIAHSLDAALDLASTKHPDHKRFVIGGAGLIEESLAHDGLRHAWWTVLGPVVEGPQLAKPDTSVSVPFKLNSFDSVAKHAQKLKGKTHTMEPIVIKCAFLKATRVQFQKTRSRGPGRMWLLTSCT